MPPIDCSPNTGAPACVVDYNNTFSQTAGYNTTVFLHNATCTAWKKSYVFVYGNKTTLGLTYGGMIVYGGEQNGTRFYGDDVVRFKEPLYGSLVNLVNLNTNYRVKVIQFPGQDPNNNNPNSQALLILPDCATTTTTTTTTTPRPSTTPAPTTTPTPPIGSSSYCKSPTGTVCIINDYNTTFTIRGDNQLYFLRNLNCTAWKRAYLQVWGNKSIPGLQYGGMVVWDGEQDGTRFVTGDTVVFEYNLSALVNLNTPYKVEVIKTAYAAPNYPGSQFLLIKCANSSSSSTIFVSPPQSTTTFKYFDYATSLATYSNSTDKNLTSDSRITSKNLVGVTIGTNVTGIGTYGFAGAPDLKGGMNGDGTLIIPGNVKEVSAASFIGCNLLTKVVFGSGVERVGVNAFKDCGSIREFRFLGDPPLAAGNAFGVPRFNGIPAYAYYCPTNNKWNQLYGGTSQYGGMPKTADYSCCV
jgi:hypothetical protein